MREELSKKSHVPIYLLLLTEILEERYIQQKFFEKSSDKFLYKSLAVRLQKSKYFT